MSFNIRYDAESDGENRWETRRDRVAGLMRWHGADFIGAQEVLRCPRAPCRTPRC